MRTQAYGIPNFDVFLTLCERAMECNDGTSEWQESLADSEHMQLSATKYVTLEDLEYAFDRYCSKCDSSRKKTPDKLTREILAKYKMTLRKHEGKDIVTGLEYLRCIDTTRGHP